MNKEKNIIATERLFLTVPDEQDLAGWQTIFRDPEVMKYSASGGGCLSVEQIKEKIKGFREEYDEKGYTVFSIIRKDDNALIGMCGIHISYDYLVEGKNRVEIVYRLAKAYWKKGYAFEAAKAVLAYAARLPDVSEVVAVIDVLNENSKKLAEKLGMPFWKQTTILGIKVNLYRLFVKTRV